MGKRGSEALRSYRLAAISEMLDDGLSISKIAKKLDMAYQLACTYKDLIEGSKESVKCKD